MFNNTTIIKCSVLISNLIAAVIFHSPVNAQIQDSSYEFLSDISAGKNVNWQFSSATESISLQDEIAELQEYDFSRSRSVLDGEIMLRERTWDKNRNVENFSIYADIEQF